MNVHTQKSLIAGPIGQIEIAVDLPDAVREGGAAPRGIALVAHPHPLFGGTMDNKVAQTLARTLVQLNYVVYRSNFRGVGATEGVHDNGTGEADDLLAVLAHMRAQPAYADLPLVLAGFSFGTFVLSHVAKRLRDAAAPSRTPMRSAPCRRFRRGSRACSRARRPLASGSRPCR
ncbi:hypothetical protein QM306_13190, partial [Burkholderia cenocepacia]|nr:hypothetical protein [Burkholderia cenocepacia]